MLESAIQLFPRYGAARFTLATVYRQLGEQSMADGVLDNYERDKLQVPPIADPAMAAIRGLDASATGLLRASYAMERQGQLPQAAAPQEQAVAADPTITQAWVNLIAVYARLDQAPKAEMAYRKAIPLEPNNAEAHYNFGTVCAQTNRFDDACKAFEPDPGNANALDSLGAIIEQDGAWDRAATLYHRAVVADPKLCLAHDHLGRSYANQRRYPEEIQQFERSIEPATAQTPTFLYALGATHARAGAHLPLPSSAIWRHCVVANINSLLLDSVST